MSDMSPIELQSYLGGIEYPVRKATLLEHARSQGAEADAISLLERIPEREYSSPADVTSEAGEGIGLS